MNEQPDQTETLPEPHDALTAGWLYIAGKLGGKLTDLTTFVAEQNKNVDAAMSDYRNKRLLYSRYMVNDFTDRVTDDEDNIFAQSNETLGAIRSQITFKAARTKGDLFGSKPFFTASPEGAMDGPLSEKIYQHFEWKLSCADAQETMEKMIDSAFNLGEAIVRISWRRDVDKYTQKLIVVGKKVEGKSVPILTEKGGYITADMDIMYLDEGGNEIEQVEGEEPQGTPVFRDAPKVLVPTDTGETVWLRWAVDNESVRYEGLDLKQVDFTAFRCSPGYANVADAPFRGHVWEIRRSDLLGRLLNIYGPKDNWPAEITALWELSGTQTSTSQQEPSSQLSVRAKGDEKNPLLKMLDAEILWDPKGEGDARWFFVSMLLDHEQAVPVYVDFLANELPTGHRIHRSLYNIIAIDRLPNSWVGRGEWEKFDEDNAQMDRMWNNMLVTNSFSANPMTFINKDAFASDIAEMQFRPGAKFQVKTNFSPADGIHVFQMPDTNHLTSNLLNFKMTNNMLETGVTSAAKGGMGDMPATNTATGIQSVLASGSTLHQAPSNDCRRGFEILLTNAASVLYARQDKNETFTYGDGDDQITATLSAADVRDLALNIRFLMTRMRNTEIVEKARTALGVLAQWFGVPEMEKGPVRPVFISLLKGLEIADADKVIREPMEQDPNAVQPQQDPVLIAVIKAIFPHLTQDGKAKALEKIGYAGFTADMFKEEDEVPENEKDAVKDKEPERIAV